MATRVFGLAAFPPWLAFRRVSPHTGCRHSERSEMKRARLPQGWRRPLGLWKLAFKAAMVKSNGQAEWGTRRDYKTWLRRNWYSHVGLGPVLQRNKPERDTPSGDTSL